MERAEILMTDDEFNVLDELYFVQSFEQVLQLSGYSEEKLIPILKSLQKQGWVKFLQNVDDEWADQNLSNDQLSQSYFLATKSGLLAHNS